MGEVWRTSVVHDYFAKISGFSDNIGTLALSIVDADTTIWKEDYNDITIRINQSLSKPYEDVSLMSNFQVGYNSTKINAKPMQLDHRYCRGKTASGRSGEAHARQIARSEEPQAQDARATKQARPEKKK